MTDNKSGILSWIGELNSIFKNNPEEYNRALAIFAVLTDRIRHEVMPEVEELIARKRKMYFFIPKTLNNDERKGILGVMCKFALLHAMYDVRETLKHNETKADALNAHLLQLFSEAFAFPIDDIVKLEQVTGDSRIINRTMSQICSIVQREGDLLLSTQLGMMCIKKLTLIEVETVDMLCTCPKEKLVEKVENKVKVKQSSTNLPTKDRKGNNDGGISRLEYFFGMIVVFVINGFSFGATQGESSVALLGIIVALALSFVLVGMRLHNIGMSSWWSLLILVPVANIYIGMKCIMYPKGYQDTKKLDNTSKIIAGIIFGLALISLGSMAIYFTK